jgi:MinD superfamily P-loop ATPase
VIKASAEAHFASGPGTPDPAPEGLPIHTGGENGFMRVAVASGKGGTGKTTVASNLAYLASQDGRTAAYVDCDVEEPNGHLFLKPSIASTQPVGRLYPVVDQHECTHCGLCGEICSYSAILCVGGKVLVYPELCHACGGCSLVCRPGAITEVLRTIGKVETGFSGAVRFVHGVLDVGEAMSAPLIRKVKAAAPAGDLVVIDAPPGTSCPVIESVRGTDFVLLVTEPTPFGLNDLKLAVATVRALNLPFGVVINRADVGDGETSAYCRAQGIEILAEIPDDRRVAEAYSRGILACEAVPAFGTHIVSLLNRVYQAIPPARVAAR